MTAEGILPAGKGQALSQSSKTAANSAGRAVCTLCRLISRIDLADDGGTTAQSKSRAGTAVNVLDDQPLDQIRPAHNNAASPGQPIGKAAENFAFSVKRHTLSRRQSR